MAMGSQNKVVLSNEMQRAKQDFQTYRLQVAAIVKELDSTVNTLLTSFKGDAADGFAEFYNNSIASFFAKGGTFDQYLGMFDKEGDGLLDSIEKTLIGGEGLDPSLGQNNRTLGKPAEK
jgi:hypothetical protein